MSSERTVTIIGAGVGGLTLAAVLERNGVNVRIFEQSKGFSRVGTGIGCTPNAVRVLWGLGLKDKLDPISYEPEYRVSREGDTGKEIFRSPLKGYFLERFGAPRLLFHRGDLHQVLNEMVSPGVVRFGMQLQTAEQRDDKVLLRFANGDEELCDAVVAADGVHSVIREALFGVPDTRYSGMVAYRSVFPVELMDRPLQDPDSKWWGPDRHIVVYYVSAGREVYFTTSVPHDDWIAESFSAEGSLEELRDAFAGFHPELRRVLDACPKTQKWAIYNRQPLPTWQNGVAALLGDACHPMTPFMQQGAATAMEDATILGRCIVEGGDASYQETFARYEAIRKPRTTVIQHESNHNRWNKTMIGNNIVSPEWVYSYDAWNTPLDELAVMPEKIAAYEATL
jgi:6-hydroxynicotinate 3-monooxygenase